MLDQAEFIDMDLLGRDSAFNVACRDLERALTVHLFGFLKHGPKGSSLNLELEMPDPP